LIVVVSHQIVSLVRTELVRELARLIVIDECFSVEFHRLYESRCDIDFSTLDVERLRIDRPETFLKGIQMVVGTVVELDGVVCTLAEREEFES